MEVLYRKSFLKDLKKLRNRPEYDRVFQLAFSDFPKSETIRDVTGVKPMRGYLDRYRIRIGNYRVGVEFSSNKVEFMRVLHRRDFYRYFP